MERQKYLNKHSETAKKEWKQLKKSSNVFTIHVNEENEDGDRKSSVTERKGTLDKVKGNGADIYINLDQKATNGAPNALVQAHEIAHAIDDDNDFSPTVTQISIKETNLDVIKAQLSQSRNEASDEREYRASIIENKIRSELDPSGTKTPLREGYETIHERYSILIKKCITIHIQSQ